ncbi:MAG: hypothetical protein GYB31_12690 [Bacteroidetes bacterium]|nr:hypothetical protein [Bacteroidota bacterium]
MPDTTRFLVREVSPKVALNEAFAERQLVRIEKDSLLNFPGSTISRVIFQELNGRGGHGLESVFEIRTGKSKELRPAEYQPFLELLHNPKSYGQYTAACHDPRVGLIFYNESDHIIGYISLCLACNNVYTRPRLAGLGLSYQDAGFSKISRKKLRELFANWGFPDDYLGIFDGVTGEE